MSKGAPGKVKSEDHKAKIRAWWTPERKEERARQRTGKNHSEETKRKIGQGRKGKKGVRTVGMTGRTHTAEARRKISLALVGNQRTKGHRLSEEHKAKVRASWTPERRAQAAERSARRLNSQSSSGTRPERVVAERLESLGVEFEAQAIIDGDPYHVWDFAIPSSRLLVEVDGCYWHGCKRCGLVARPETIRKDRIKTTTAKRLGWKLIRIKEHSL